MRYLTTITLSALIGNTFGQVTINGKIENYDGKSKVFYSPTIEGIQTSFDNVSREVKPNPNGSFRIKYDTKGIGTTRIGFHGITYIFVHSDQTEVTFIIDQAKINFPKNKKHAILGADSFRDSVKQAATVSIDGDLASINRYNNRMIRTSTVTFKVDGCDYSKVIRQAETPAEVVDIVDSLVSIELDAIRRLGVELTSESDGAGKIAPELKEFLSVQVYSFYGSVFLNGMMLKRLDQKTKSNQNPNARRELYNENWERLIEEFLLRASNNIIPTPNSFEYNEFVSSCAFTLANYKDYDFNPPRITDDELVIERLLSPNLPGMDSLKLLNDKAILAYKMQNLSRFLYTQTFYSPVLLSAINELKALHPNSPLFDPFQEKINVLTNYLKTVSKTYEEAHFIETNFLRLSDLLEPFRGRNVLIDIWATWCAPCIDDFNYKSTYTSFLDKNDFTVLYISIDKSDSRKKWKENIRYNQLAGHHVMANDVLIEDIWRELGGPQGVIPRYALVNKSGSIFLTSVARPEESDKLKAQIESLLQAN